MGNLPVKNVYVPGFGGTWQTSRMIRIVTIGRLSGSTT